MVQRDLPFVLQIEQHSPAPRWSQQDFLNVFQSGDTASWVAESRGRVVGFVVYSVQPLDDEDTLELHAAAQENESGPRPVRICLHKIAVARDWRRRGIGRALLERLNKKLRLTQDCIQATVPESNLTVQLFLRSARCKALRVLRGYFGDEDGYLMERQRD
jgi:ribosomal protein S18 acetylase RimI-like enzyme